MEKIFEAISNQTDLSKLAVQIIKFKYSQFNLSDPFNQVKTYKAIDTLSQLLTRRFPHIFIVQNISNHIKQLIKTRISEIQSESNNTVSSKRANSSSNLKQLFENLSLTNAINENEQQKNDARWIKKITLQQLQNFEQQIMDSTINILGYIKTHIKSNFNILLFTHSNYIKDIIKQIQIQYPFNAQFINQTLHLRNSSRNIQKAHRVFIQCYAVLKNGGVITSSGGFLLALAAKNFSTQVIVIAPCYTLTNRLTFEHNSLCHLENPYTHFEQNGQKNYEQTLIIKKYDYIPPEYISLIITEQGESTPNYVYKIFEKYYD